MKYNHRKIEKKWQKVWSAQEYKLWRVDEKSDKPKKYVLDMFPYPSGEGLHVGHLLGYTGSDILSRYYRMRGFEVLHPMGWDAFGLPAENYAIKNKIHPSVAVKKNVKNFKKQLNAPGFSYDWSREINTTDPEYYKWTQWIFLQMFKRGLAYEADIPVNWCPQDKTVLANEEVANGCCDRCGAQVLRKKMRQWVLKITAYADRLVEDLNLLDWPEKVKDLQRNWIGRSEGALITFHLSPSTFNLGSVQVFTTRPDTLAGATYLVIAPEHELVNKFKPSIFNWDEVQKYIELAHNKSDRERQENKEKTGIELKGIKATNPLTKEEISIWISDYVLASYGTGAIMAVPAHDDRDFEFAKKFNLPIKMVICPVYPEPKCPVLDRAYTGTGRLVGSGKFDGIDFEKAKWEIVKEVGGIKKINYKLHDWIFSRQRYWGEPFPIIKCDKCGVVGVLEKDLPVKLPKVESYEPTGTGESPLASIKKWVEVKCPKCGGEARRETNTMPQWAGSCWYYLAYLISGKKLKVEGEGLKQFKSIFDQWVPVDLYIGGIEHAVLHLLYARFWHKFLYDIGVVKTKEPFQKLMNQGLMMGGDNQKMSKSRGNVISPDEMIKNFGADALRVYEMFIGPFEESKSWDPHGIVGVRRFLDRVWNFVIKNSKAKTSDEKALKFLHKTIKKVTGDIEGFRFNTAISALMIFINEAENFVLSKSDAISLLKIIFPFAPHMAQELALQLKYKKLLDLDTWPTWDEKLVIEANFELVVQINGKTRDKVVAPHGIDEDGAKKLALADANIQKWLVGKEIRKIIFVKNRLINLLV